MENPAGQEPVIELTTISISAAPPPGGWQGHEFALTSSDVFRCVNCGQYEVVITRADKTLPPCVPTPEFVAERQRAAEVARARAAIWQPRCPHAEELYDYDPELNDPGDYFACTLPADHDGPHRMSVSNSNDY